ncbi:MAG TPA: 6-carboxytetrahydropterin synthase [Bryobacteraceae bacterium]|nr:6-carboxytetrahydropterin synthase [Bryobacteraceae bacterium]
MMKLTRRYRFSASHRLSTPRLSAEENRRLYGKCNNPYGHGHDYVLDVTVEGSPDSYGQLVNREVLDGLVAERVLSRLDHRDLNTDVPELAGVVPTTENLAAAIEAALLSGWNIAPRLSKIRVSETDRNIFELENRNA